MIDRDVLIPVARSRGKVRLVNGQEATLVGVRESYARIRFASGREWTCRRAEIEAIVPPDAGGVS